jgi:uncharacterized membrane protein YiaA
MYSAFLIGAAASYQYGLLFVAGLDLAKEGFHFRILVQFEENAVHLQNPLRNQLFPVKLRQILIARIA